MSACVNVPVLAWLCLPPLPSVDHRWNTACCEHGTIISNPNRKGIVFFSLPVIRSGSYYLFESDSEDDEDEQEEKEEEAPKKKTSLQVGLLNGVIDFRTQQDRQRNPVL